MKIGVLDIGGTAIKAGIYVDGKLLKQREFKTEAKKGGSHIMQKAIRILHEYEGFERIGISTAGQVDSDKGIIRYANSNIPEYTGTDIRGVLEKEFHVPVAVENDVNAAAIGEANFGAGRGYDDFLCLTYGTGIGGAIVMNRKIYKGSCFSAGEFGAIPIHASLRNPQEDMFSGCYEKFASTTALVHMARKEDNSLTNGRKIFERIEEEKIQHIVDEWIVEIVYGLTALVHIFNPSCIILGGGVMKQKYILKKLSDILYNSIMDSDRNVIISPAQLGNMAGLLGAAQIAMDFI